MCNEQSLRLWVKRCERVEGVIEKCVIYPSERGVSVGAVLFYRCVRLSPMYAKEVHHQQHTGMKNAFFSKDSGVSFTWESGGGKAGRVRGSVWLQPPLQCAAAHACLLSYTCAAHTHEVCMVPVLSISQE